MSLSMLGAQREITGFLIDHGYTPAGLWEPKVECEHGQAHEIVRKFRVVVRPDGSPL
ncbi:hypothetical protein [Micromonospora chersina]|uniref:hypothetical protein n=1 Tax=Micromonospora chersina TaxID=47854 RepID=UPI003719A7BB